MHVHDPPEPVFIGRGRSAVVHRVTSSDGCVEARKAFLPDDASSLVFLVLEGAPNPYGWCEQAVGTALLRRRILSVLVRHWFGERLRLPVTSGTSWNAELGAFQLQMEYVRGRHAPLRHRHPRGAVLPVRELHREIMRPLQHHLLEAGFVGLVWQAGLGNPVAASNFMLEHDAAGEPRRWVWVDLESGVPALFPLDPRALFGFYLPRSFRAGRPLFDDVDVPRLRQYVLAHADELTDAVGEGAVERLVDDVARLEELQREWKAIGRVERGIRAALVRGRITAEQAETYRRAPLRWTTRMAVRGARSACRRAMDGARRVARRIGRIDVPRIAASSLRFVASQRFRAHLARTYVAGRIRSWRQRGCLDAAAARGLRRALRRDGTESCITDFGVHLLVKPFVKLLQFGVLPGAYAMGWIGEGVLATTVVAGGSIVRTLYTLGRMLQTLALGQRLPWVALVVGTLPVIGNAAFPAELVARGYAGTGTDGDDATRDLGSFVLHDTCSAVGRGIPIWGGADTLTEHAFAALPRLLGVGREPGRDRCPEPPRAPSLSTAAKPVAEEEGSGLRDASTAPPADVETTLHA